MNIQVLRKFKQKGQTPPTLNFDGVTPLNWVVDLSRPLRACHVTVFGQLCVAAGGGTDPNQTLDPLLKMLGTMQVTINNDKGDIDIVPAGTRVEHYFRFVQNLSRKMANDAEGGFIKNQPVLNGEDGMAGVDGKLSPNIQPFAVKIPILFQFIGGAAHEIDKAMFVPRPGDLTMTITFTPSMATTGDYAPFPNSNRVYTFKDFYGSGTVAKATMILDQIQKVTDPKAGLYLPRFQQKSFTLTAGGAAQNEFLVQNWERGGLWHAIAFFEQYITANNGGMVRGNIINSPGSEGAADSFTNLADFTILANTERILEDNLLHLIAEQCPFEDNEVYAINGNTVRSSRLPNTPVILSLARGKSMAGLYDFSPYVQPNLQINMQFDNLLSPVSNKENVDILVLRYQPRT